MLTLENASSLNLIIAVATAGANLIPTTGSANTFAFSSFGYIVNGAPKFKAGLSGQATPTSDGNTGATFPSQAINTAAAYVWAINAAGTFQVFKGPTVPWTDTTAGSTVLTLPPVPSTSVPFAVQVIQNGASGASWTFGSGNWNATGINAVAVTPTLLAGALPLTPSFTA